MGNKVSVQANQPNNPPQADNPDNMPFEETEVDGEPLPMIQSDLFSHDDDHEPQQNGHAAEAETHRTPGATPILDRLKRGSAKKTNGHRSKKTRSSLELEVIPDGNVDGSVSRGGRKSNATVVHLDDRNEEDDDEDDLPDVSALFKKTTELEHQHEHGQDEDESEDEDKDEDLPHILDIEPPKGSAKKRGRASIKSTEPEHDEVEEPARKKRGRPSASEKGVTKPVTSTQRGRGRPSKSRDTSPLKKKPASQSHQTANLGRPRRAAAESAKASMSTQTNKKARAPSTTKASTTKRTGKKSTAEPKKPAKESAPEVEQEYEVEKIVKSRKRKGIEEFNVKWKGFPASQNTWEPLEHLKCNKLLREFRASQK